MAKTTDDFLPVLRFWRDVEIFNIPTAPSARDSNEQTKITTLRPGDPLPWQLVDFAPTGTHGHVHVVYLGVADAEDLCCLLLRSLFPGRDLSERERQRLAGNGWLAAFVVDERGLPKPDSYLPASFAHGAAALRETAGLDNVNARLERAKEEFAQRCHRLPSLRDIGNASACSDASPEAALDWDRLDEEAQVVRRLLGEGENDRTLDWRLVVRTVRVKRRFLADNLQAATDFLNSFYLDDLDRLIALAQKNRPFGKALSAYLGPALDERQRVDILAQRAAMTRLLSAKRLPSARWPAPTRHPLVFAQQAAVGQVIRSLGNAEGLIGINGPPGTGKTTLLCDVIAEIVTERAGRIAALDRPVALFGEKTTVAGKSFYPLRAEVVAGTSIVVASSNNNAVKNISQELPARKKVADEFGPVDYFAEVMGEVFKAQKVKDEDDRVIEGWGAIAAALGNAGNRRSFVQGFFRDEYVPPRQGEDSPPPDRERDADTGSPDGDPNGSAASLSPRPSMRQILEAAAGDYRRYQGDWRMAKEAFLALKADFERRRKVLERAEEAALRIDIKRESLNALQAEILALEGEIPDGEHALAQRCQAQTHQLALVQAHQAMLAQASAATPPNLWDRMMGLLGRQTPRMMARRRSLEAPTQALADASAALAQMSKESAWAGAELERQRARLKAALSQQAKLDRVLESDKKALQAGYAAGAKCFPDARFWELPADERQRASMAVSADLDTLRAKLFLQAVELHRLTVLANAGKFIANLRCVSGMLTGNARDKLSAEQRPLLWDAFFFVVPVVSATLASFDRLFSGMGQNSLGWLLIDEAGQATPQSAAGAIWRSRRAVIVGDPLQIEPVFTVPFSLVEDLRRRHGVAAHWSPSDESVQTLADRVTPFGSWVETCGGDSRADARQRLWTGMPLRTHRRCDDPMFAIANRIAYAGQMVQGRVDEAGRPTPWAFSCPLGESAWFDVQSSRVRHPVSEDEIACLLDCLQRLRCEPSGKTRIFVVSPFRKIAQACRERVYRAALRGIECGTVHTFQGKEAEIAFLVLGTAPGQSGSGARSWAASKPNLLNVAVTRAKCRLYVIGDAAQWSGLDYFRELARELPRRRVEELRSRPSC
ncbi:MAG: ATP-binding protein [Rhodocyclaceae bacterium]